MLLGMSGLFLIKMKLPGSGSSFLSFADAAEMRTNLDGCINVFRYYWNMGTLGPWAMGLLLLLTGLGWIIGKKTAISRLTLSFGLMALLFTIWSKWVFLNDSGIRYWALPLVLILLATLLNKGRLVRLLRLLWLSAVLWAGWHSTHYAVEGFRFTPDRPSRAEITEIAEKIDGHVLADYWSPYLLQVFDPKLKVSHPRAKGRTGPLELGRGRAGRLHLVCQSPLPRALGGPERYFDSGSRQRDPNGAKSCPSLLSAIKKPARGGFV